MEIEQVGNDEGQTKFCWPETPDYSSADATYKLGLAEPPEGGNRAWRLANASFSIAGMEFVFIPGLGNFPWMAMQQDIVSELKDDITAAATSFNMRIPANTSGLLIDDIVHVGTEAMKVTSVAGSPLQVTRGQLGTKAVAHVKHEDLLMRTPSLVGRRITLRRFTIVGSSSATEKVVYKGWISAEPAADTDFVVLKSVTTFSDGEINVEPSQSVFLLPFGRDDIVTTIAVSGEVVDGFVADTAPLFATGGANWWVPDADTVYEATYDGVSRPTWLVNVDPVIGDPLPSREVDVSLSRTENLRAYEVVLSDADRPHAPFGYDPDGADPFIVSDHPAVIVANLLLSRDGTNVASGRHNFDVSALATLSLDIDVADFDQDAFESIIFEVLPGMRAARLWLGGPDRFVFDQVVRRLLAPWYVAVGVNGVGKWTALRIRDVFDADNPTALDDSNMLRPELIGQVNVGRTLDSLDIHVDPTPSGKSGSTVSVEEITGRTWFRRHVGRRQTFRNSPYARRHFRRDDPAWLAVARAVRRLADRLPVISAQVDETFLDIDLGSPVTISNTAIYDPVTGNDWAVGDAPLRGLVIQLDPNWDDESAAVHIAITNTGNVGEVAPAATVSSWDSPSKTATCAASDYVGAAASDTDVDRFEVGAVCLCMTSRGVLRHDDGTSQPQPNVTSIGTNTLTFSGNFLLSGGGTYTPVAGDVITYARYRDQPQDIRDKVAFGADDGEPDVVADLNGDAPFVYGD